MGKRVFIILVNYRSVEDTIECVNSLEKIKYDNYDIVIVDNDSKDGSFEKLKEAYKGIHHVIPSGKNGGFAYGNNIGIKYALNNGADYVLLLNNDTAVKDDFLIKLVNTAERNEDCGIATGLILNYYDNNKVWFGGGRINWDRFYGEHLDEGKDVREITLKKKEITFATGCLMLIKKSIIEKAGLLPEDYFMYYEDVDYCANIQSQGYSIYFEPESIIYHKVSAASGEEESPFAVKWNTRNRIRFIRKYRNRISNISYIKLMSFFYLSRIIKVVSYYMDRRSDKVKALLDGLRGAECE